MHAITYFYGAVPSFTGYRKCFKRISQNPCLYLFAGDFSVQLQSSSNSSAVFVSGSILPHLLSSQLSIVLFKPSLASTPSANTLLDEAPSLTVIFGFAIKPAKLVLVSPNLDSNAFWKYVAVYNVLIKGDVVVMQLYASDYGAKQSYKNPLLYD